MPESNQNDTRQDRRSKRKSNRRKMRVHGRGMKRNLAKKKPAKSAG